MAVSDELAAAVGRSADELRWVDDLPADRQEALLASARGDDLGFGKRFALRTGETAANQPSEAASGAAEAFSNAFKLGVPATAAAAGGTFAASKFFESEEQRFRAMAKEDASKAMLALLNDPNLTGEQKREIFARLAKEGFFTPGGGPGGDGDGGGGVLSKLGINLGDSGFLEWVVILMVLYFAGKAAVEYVGSGSGGGN